MSCNWNREYEHDHGLSSTYIDLVPTEIHESTKPLEKYSHKSTILSPRSIFIQHLSENNRGSIAIRKRSLLYCMYFDFQTNLLQNSFNCYIKSKLRHLIKKHILIIRTIYSCLNNVLSKFRERHLLFSKFIKYLTLFYRSLNHESRFRHTSPLEIN